MHRSGLVPARTPAAVLHGGAAPDGLLSPDGELPPGLLADLYDPRLVISADYVGRDRRRPRPMAPRGRSSHGPSLRVRQAIVVVVVTAAAVVPLTLMAARTPVHAAPRTSAIRSVATVPPAKVARTHWARAGRAARVRQAELARTHRARSGRAARGLVQVAHVKASAVLPVAAIGAETAVGTRAAATAPVLCAETSETMSPANCVRFKAAEDRRALRSARHAYGVKHRGRPAGNGARMTIPGQ
jgi:hypothetical protein